LKGKRGLGSCLLCSSGSRSELQDADFQKNRREGEPVKTEKEKEGDLPNCAAKTEERRGVLGLSALRGEGEGRKRVGAASFNNAPRIAILLRRAQGISEQRTCGKTSRTERNISVRGV